MQIPKTMSLRSTKVSSLTGIAGHTQTIHTFGPCGVHKRAITYIQKVDHNLSVYVSALHKILSLY